MDALDPAQAAASSSITRLLPTLAGLLVAAIVAFSAVSPPAHYVSWISLLSFALRRMLAVSLAGIVTFFAGHSSIGAALFGAAVCAWTWWSGCDATSLNASQSFNLRIGVVAMLFMVAALIPYLRGATGFGLGSSHKYAARILTGGNAPRQRYASQVLDDSTKTPSDGNSGIVLWPEKQLHTKLVAPTPTDLKSKPLSGRNPNPLTIPFDGVYWF